MAARLVAVAAVALVLAYCAMRLARVDGGIGAALGPDRLLERIDADPATGAADAADARSMLVDRPIDGRAWRVLAQSPGNDEASLLAIAMRRAPRDRIIRALLADRAFAAGDVAGAMEQVDALLRVAPWLGVPMLQRLLALSADDRVRRALLDRLGTDPPWRAALPRALSANGSDPGLALALLDGLAASKSLPARERKAQVALLRQAGRAREARAAWLAALPATAHDARSRWLYDGGFEHDLDADGGYGWRIGQVPGVFVDFDPASPLQGHRALAVDFAGRAIAGFRLAQWLALAPGRYRLRAALDDGTDSERPFRWQLACSGDGRLLVELDSEPGRRGWQRLAGRLVVPPGCSGQELWLEQEGRNLDERRFEGRLRVDGVAVNPG